MKFAKSFYSQATFIAMLLVFIIPGGIQVAVCQATGVVLIPGTKYSITPPEEFVTASGFSGFQHAGTGSSIMFVDMPAAYQTMLKGFDDGALKAQGMEVFEVRAVTVNGVKGSMFKIRQSANGVNYLKDLLVFGDDKHTVMLNGIYPEVNKSIAGEIQKAMFSIRYDSTLREDPLGAVNFSVDVTGSDFKFAKSMSGALLYSVDGKVPSETPALIIAKSIGGVTPARQEAFAKERIKKYPRGEESLIRETRPITIDNMDGYEIIADGKSKNGKPALVYQVMLFDSKGEYYLVLGQCSDDIPKYLQSYKSVAKTFKRK